MDRQTTEHPYNGILFNNEKNEWLNCEKTWKNLTCALLSKRSQSGKATYCMVPNIWHSRKGKTLGTLKTWGGRKEGRNRWNIRNF